MLKKTIIRASIMSTAAMLAVLIGAFSANAMTLSPTRFEVSGDPGQTLTEQVTVSNDTAAPVTYYSSFMNFEAEGETGTPNFVTATDDLGTWMQMPDSVDLGPGQSKIVPLTIFIPKDATPGGHFAAAFWGTQPISKVNNGVALGAKVGVLVLLRVNGDVSEQGGIVEYNTLNAQRFYTSLPVNFYYRFQNSGGDRIDPKGDIVIKDMIGITAAKVPGNPVDGNILPASTRKFATVWQGGSGPTAVAPADQGNFFNKVGYEWRNFAFGHYSATISLAYGTKNEISTASVGFWVFPWHLTIFVILLALIIFFVANKLIRSYNAWVIRMARESMQQAQKTDTK